MWFCILTPSQLTQGMFQMEHVTTTLLNKNIAQIHPCWMDIYFPTKVCGNVHETIYITFYL